MIVDVAESIGQLLGDERELAPRQPADRVALRQHHLSQRRDVAFEVEDLPRQLRVRLLEHLGLELVEPLLELVGFGPVVVDQRVDDPVHQRSRAFAEQLAVPRADPGQLVDRSGFPVMDGNQEPRRQEEVHVLGLEAVLAGLEVYAVENQIEVIAVRLDLGMMNLVERVLDGELVDVEDVRQEPRLLGRRVVHDDPEKNVLPRVEPGRVHALDRGGDPVLVLEDLDHSVLRSRPAEAGRDSSGGTGFQKRSNGENEETKKTQ